MPRTKVKQPRGGVEFSLSFLGRLVDLLAIIISCSGGRILEPVEELIK